MAPKGDQATFGFDGLIGGLRDISTRRDKHLISPNLPEELARVIVAGFTVIDTSNARFDGAKVIKGGEPLFSLGDKVRKGWLWVLHPYCLSGIPGGNPESDSVFPIDLGDGFDDFEWESSAVLNRSTVFARRLVGDVLKELIWKVALGEVKFDSVKPSLVDGPVGRGDVLRGISLDFVDI